MKIELLLITVGLEGKGFHRHGCYEGLFETFSSLGEGEGCGCQAGEARNDFGDEPKIGWAGVCQRLADTTAQWARWTMPNAKILRGKLRLILLCAGTMRAKKNFEADLINCP